jgi:hypothetical protein
VINSIEGVLIKVLAGVFQNTFIFIRKNRPICGILWEPVVALTDPIYSNLNRKSVADKEGGGWNVLRGPRAGYTRPLRP